MDLYDSKALDEFENELLDDSLTYDSINTAKNREYYQQVAQNSIKKKALVNEIIQDKKLTSNI